ncbi:tRNA (guanosine(37)-N1)-methyltransferase TrmD [Candidatus Peregrinibacteria bacterium]|nr:tRNA (guanosine(37)-N1)-methyltransferase TrmD [Candidatus Peregrinibacteria bacterium]
MSFHILTIFPFMFQGFLNESILKKAQGNGVIEIQIHDIRSFSENRHHKVDDTPYGGGAGMVMTPQPLFDAIAAIKKKVSEGEDGDLRLQTPVIYLSPRGKRLTQPLAERLAKKHTSFILLCGHYEGIDQRVIDALVDDEISIGDYVLSGGEVPAMVFVDALSRLTPGVLGNEESHQEESFSKKLGRKKEYPHYTKPADFRGMKVPDVLLTGHHAEIEKWRQGQLK